MSTKAAFYNAQNIKKEFDVLVEGPHKHKAVPKYAPFHPYMEPELSWNAYKSRDLLNLSVKSFYGREDKDLNASQQDSKRHFVNLYNDRRKGGVYGQKVSMRDKERYEKRCARDAKMFMDYIDGFFFFGCLRNRLELVVGFDVTSGKISSKERPQSEIHSCRVDERRFARINLDIGRRNEIFGLDAIIGNLMYEMIHAWFWSFACTEGRCRADVRNTMGFDGHGPIYQMLHRLILSEMRRWDPALEPLLESDCPGETISRRVRKLDQEATDRVPEETRQNQFNRPRPSTFGRSFICITNRHEVAVKPSLKHDQLWMEDYLVARATRTREMEQDAGMYGSAPKKPAADASKSSGKQPPTPASSSSLSSLSSLSESENEEGSPEGEEEEEGEEDEDEDEDDVHSEGSKA
ncbi:hypothetical protein F5X96DRAFT_187469 [Biscogniauxia mediterranea]|nr:hypothetical protein F5X96DRAFT_187469 [Biscogniauxia mediterranea]